MEKPAFMQPTNALLPRAGFAPEALLAPRQAIIAYRSRVALSPAGTEIVSLDEALGRVLAEPIAATDDHPNTPRSAMDGFALPSSATPGTFRIAGDVLMGSAPATALQTGETMRIPTGGVLPEGADAVVPIEDARVDGATIVVETHLGKGENAVPQAADMRIGDVILQAGRRIGAGQVGALATLGVTRVPVYRKPVIGVLSSGDELVPVDRQPAPGQVRDSNRYAIAASLRAMGAQVRHYPTIRDETDDFTAALAHALSACDAIAITGGSSVGERDRLPGAVAALGDPGVVVHGLRVKPGKPTLLGALGSKPILGLPGNPTSALFILEAVAAPIIGALAGAPVVAATVTARLSAPARSRLGWTWFLPVTLGDDEGFPLAHPLPLRSFSVSLSARADGYLIMGEPDDEWAEGRLVTVHRFFGGQ
jgi:molybdopterin molybdotransferase